MAALRCVALLTLALFHSSVLAQNGSEQVWAAVVVTYYGDRIPLLSPDYSIITPLGAQQMFSAGQLFRERYVDPASGSGLTIQGIATNEVNNYQLMPLSMYDIMIDQSAQAFLAGLYPPTSNGSNTSSANLTAAALANGTIVNAPLDGLQYPQIYYAYETDPNYIYLAGTTNCPAFDESVNNYQNSDQFKSISSATTGFYNSLAGTVESALPNTTLSFGNSYGLWDWISYETIHSESIAGQITQETLQELRYLADSYNYQVFGNLTADNGIRAIGGLTLGSQILASLYANIGRAGLEYKLATLFTSFEPMMSLAAILGLPALYPQFVGMPDLGSSLVVEMYTAASDTPSNGSYPPQSSMRVRFLFRNGTESSSNLDAYPIFGNDETARDMSFANFSSAMEALVNPVAYPSGWCTACSSMAVFCAGYTDGADGLPSGPISNGGSSTSSGGMNPVIAGVIGALVALAVAGLILVAAMLVFGLRFRRAARGARVQKRSDMGGFKGSEKLASDVDLPKGGVEAGVFGAEVVKDEGNSTAGHRRVESWEMSEGRVPGDAHRPRGSLDRDEGDVKAMEAVSPI